jgi:hypothetical protein
VLRTGPACRPGEPEVGIRLFEPAELRVMLQDVGWRLVQMKAGNVLWALLGREVLQEARGNDEYSSQMTELERRLGSCRDLAGAGGEIQVLACR